MKYLEAVLNFLTTIARMLFRGKGKHKPGYPPADDSGYTGNSPKEYRSSPGSHRSDTLNLRETYPSPKKIMGGALIVCATGSYLLKLLG